MASPPSPSGRTSLSERMKGALAEYGGVAITLYLIIFAAVLVGFAVAISLGVETESTAGSAGTLAAAWLATKLTQPLRIIATLALTPLVARGLQWFRRKPEPAPPGPGSPPP